MKLTKAQRLALTWFRDNSPTKWLPIGVPGLSKATRDRLVSAGFLEEKRPTFGLVIVTYSITPSGLQALKEAG